MNALRVAPSQESKDAVADRLAFATSTQVRMAVSRFKGVETPAEAEAPSLAKLVGAALERKKVMDRVRLGFQAVRVGALQML